MGHFYFLGRPNPCMSNPYPHDLEYHCRYRQFSNRSKSPNCCPKGGIAVSHID